MQSAPRKLHPRQASAGRTQHRSRARTCTLPPARRLLRRARSLRPRERRQARPTVLNKITDRWRNGKTQAGLQSSISVALPGAPAAGRPFRRRLAGPWAGRMGSSIQPLVTTVTHHHLEARRTRHPAVRGRLVLRSRRGPLIRPSATFSPLRGEKGDGIFVLGWPSATVAEGEVSSPLPGAPPSCSSTSPSTPCPVWARNWPRGFKAGPDLEA